MAKYIFNPLLLVLTVALTIRSFMNMVANTKKRMDGIVNIIIMQCLMLLILIELTLIIT